MQHFIARDGKQYGPYSLEQLRQLAKNGKLANGDLAWREGMTAWAPVEHVLGMFEGAGGHARAAAPEQTNSLPAHATAMAAAPAYAAAAPAAAGYSPYTPPAAPLVAQQAVHEGYGGFWLRVLAYVLDSIVVSVVTIPFAFVVGLMIGFNGGSPAVAELVGNLIGIVMAWIYAAIMESSSKQATLGKMALGMKVTDEAGQRISFGRATGRHFSKILSGMLLCIGFIMVAFDQRKQGLHDKIAGTLVVRA